jgi:hypothetical protein
MRLFAVSGSVGIILLTIPPMAWLRTARPSRSISLPGEMTFDAVEPSA